MTKEKTADQKIEACASVDNTVDFIKEEECYSCGEMAPRYSETINHRPKCEKCCRHEASDRKLKGLKK